MIPIIIDDVLFEVYGDKTLWSPPSANGAFVEAPDAYTRIARALVCCDYDDRDGHVYVGSSQLHQHAEPGSLIHFPLKAGVVTMRAKRVITGLLNGVKLITVLEWDDPLDAVITASEADALYGLAKESASKAAWRSFPARKSGKVWLLRRVDAEREWG